MTSAKKALIVHAHPEPQSFCTAQMRQAAQTLQAQGYDVEVLDPYASGWNPVLSEQDFGHETPPFFKPQAEQVKAVRERTLSGEVREQVDKLKGADLLIFSFPLWWFSVPAILKGWVDRVFVMGEI